MSLIIVDQNKTEKSLITEISLGPVSEKKTSSVKQLEKGKQDFYTDIIKMSDQLEQETKEKTEPKKK